jgi:hypothetical protein
VELRHGLAADHEGVKGLHENDFIMAAKLDRLASGATTREEAGSLHGSPPETAPVWNAGRCGTWRWSSSTSGAGGRYPRPAATQLLAAATETGAQYASLPVDSVRLIRTRGHDHVNRRPVFRHAGVSAA